VTFTVNYYRFLVTGVHFSTARQVVQFCSAVYINAVMKYGQKFQEDLDYLMDDRIEDYSERYESWQNIKRQNEDQPEQGKSDE
jgi:hypothetical protein